MSIAFWYIGTITGLIIATHEPEYIFFLAVYGVDAVLTIIHRLKLKENIFEAHRLHLYQLLANEGKISHLTVAVLYGILQLIINSVIIFTSLDFITTGLISCLPLALVYLF